MVKLKSKIISYILIFMTLLWICECEDDDFRVLIVTLDQISLLDLKTEQTSIIANVPGGRSDYHSGNGAIYWADWNNRCVWRVNQIGDISMVVEESNNYYPGDVAVDSVNDRLYWASSISGSDTYRLSVSDLQGSNIVYIDSVSFAWCLEIDAKQGLLFTAGRSIVEKYRIDGSTIIIENIIIDHADIYGLSIDRENERMYFSGNGYGISSIGYDGSNLRRIYDGKGSIMLQMFVHKEYIYFLSATKKIILKSDKSGENVTTLVTMDEEIGFMIAYVLKGPCQEYKSIKNEEKRSAGYVMDLEVDYGLSDEDLGEDWYRVYSDTGDNMPTSPPGARHCGTHNPIWLNGTFPEDDEGSVTRIACIQTVTDICEQTIEIEIQKCDEYYLYYLQNTTNNSSYCFGSGAVACPNGFSSESGFYPGCSSSFPHEVTSVFVKAELAVGNPLTIPGYDQNPSLIPVFTCRFVDLSNETNVYDVYWYINGDEITTTKNLRFNEINSTDLYPSTWISNYHLNMEVQCGVRSRFTVNSTPSPFVYSGVFLAGLFPDRYEYTVVEGESINIEFTSTVPVGCISSHQNIRSRCHQNFYVFQPGHEDILASCANNIVNRDIVFKAQFCGINIGSLDWGKNRTLQVYGYSDGLYNNHARSSFIRLSTSALSMFNDIWKDLDIPNIKVTVLDKDVLLSKRICQSYNDPHISTFDGKYYHYMEVGEFVLYRNDKGPYWVHVLLTNCGFGWQGSSCHCGIAIRSRNSLLVIRTCQTVSRTRKYLLQRPIMQLASCDDNDLSIEPLGSRYKVTFPIGTEIQFSISRWSRFLSGISVKPSIYDINTAKGLCGYPSTTKDPTDDFMHRYNGPIDDDQLFGDSWRISPPLTDEQLFVDEPEFLKRDYTTEESSPSRYCVCDTEASSVDSLDDFSTIHCNLTEKTEYCSESSQSSANKQKAFFTTCSSITRTIRSADFQHSVMRRSTDGSDDTFESQTLTYDETVYSQEKVVPNTFRNGWTQDKAYTKCRETLLNALPDVLTDYVDIEENGYVESCVMDIELVGDTTFLSDTLSAIVTRVSMELARNESLYNMTTIDGSQTMLEYFTNFLCPNNCSNSGNCTAGVCSCFDQYIGDDCSQLDSEPPSDLSLPFDGQCTLGNRECKTTNIYGNFMSSTVWYKLKYFEIHADSISYTTEEEIYVAIYRNIFMITLELPLHRRKRSTSENAIGQGYDISLSYDRSNFGNSVVLVIYNDNCYTCNATSVSCSDKGVCTSATKNDISILVPIGVSVGVVTIVIVLVVGLFLKFKYSNKKIGSLNTQRATKVSVREPTSGENWMTRQTTISDLDLNIEYPRIETPVELFLNNSLNDYNKQAKD